jgi:hypothetical protein
MASENDPTTFPIITYVWVFGLSIMGGFAAFMRKLKAGDARMFNFVEFIGEVVTSAFAGLITFYLCEAAKLDSMLSAALVGIAGHMGSRAVFLLEKFLSDKFLKP